MAKFEVRYIELKREHIVRRTGGNLPNLSRILWLLMLPPGDTIYSPIDVVGLYLSFDDDPELFERCRKALETASTRMGRKRDDTELGPDNLDPKAQQLLDRDGKPTNAVMWKADSWRTIISKESNNRAFEFMETLKTFAEKHPQGTRFYADFDTLEITATQVKPVTERPGVKKISRVLAWTSPFSLKKTALAMIIVLGILVADHLVPNAASEVLIGNHLSVNGYFEQEKPSRPNLGSHYMGNWKANDVSFKKLEALAGLEDFY